MKRAEALQIINSIPKSSDEVLERDFEQVDDALVTLSDCDSEKHLTTEEAFLLIDSINRNEDLFEDFFEIATDLLSNAEGWPYNDLLLLKDSNNSSMDMIKSDAIRSNASINLPNNHSQVVVIHNPKDIENYQDLIQLDALSDNFYRFLLFIIGEFYEPNKSLTFLHSEIRTALINFGVKNQSVLSPNEEQGLALLARDI